MEPILSRAQIQEILPHRHPMLLVDEVTALEEGKEICSVFRVNEDMDIFKGHYPGNPIFPGIYTVEALAQTSAILAFYIEKYKGKTPLFFGIKTATFRKIIRPGDILQLHVSFLSDYAEKAIVTCGGKAFVGNDLVTECELSIAFR